MGSHRVSFWAFFAPEAKLRQTALTGQWTGTSQRPALGATPQLEYAYSLFGSPRVLFGLPKGSFLGLPKGSFLGSLRVPFWAPLRVPFWAPLRFLFWGEP